MFFYNSFECVYVCDNGGGGFYLSTLIPFPFYSDPLFIGTILLIPIPFLVHYILRYTPISIRHLNRDLKDRRFCFSLF